MAARLKYKITDMSKLKAAYPELVTEEQVVRDVVDKEKLYKLVKTMHSIGRSVDGIETDLNAEPEFDLDNAAATTGEEAATETSGDETVTVGSEDGEDPAPADDAAAETNGDEEAPTGKRRRR